MAPILPTASGGPRTTAPAHGAQRPRRATPPTLPTRSSCGPWALVRYVGGVRRAAHTSHAVPCTVRRAAHAACRVVRSGPGGARRATRPTPAHGAVVRPLNLRARGWAACGPLVDVSCGVGKAPARGARPGHPLHVACAGLGHTAHRVSAAHGGRRWGLWAPGPWCATWPACAEQRTRRMPRRALCAGQRMPHVAPACGPLVGGLLFGRTGSSPLVHG